MRKSLAFFMLLVFILLGSGCQTIAGGVKGAVEGAKQDWAELKKADAWVRKNLW